MNNGTMVRQFKSRRLSETGDRRPHSRFRQSSVSASPPFRGTALKTGTGTQRTVNARVIAPRASHIAVTSSHQIARLTATALFGGLLYPQKTVRPAQLCYAVTVTLWALRCNFETRPPAKIDPLVCSVACAFAIALAEFAIFGWLTLSIQSKGKIHGNGAGARTCDGVTR
jgi:hypothetical protein